MKDEHSRKKIKIKDFSSLGCVVDRNWEVEFCTSSWKKEGTWFLRYIFLFFPNRVELLGLSYSDQKGKPNYWELKWRGDTIAVFSGWTCVTIYTIFCYIAWLKVMSLSHISILYYFTKVNDISINNILVNDAVDMAISNLQSVFWS